MTVSVKDLALLRLMQLVSPALPVGAYAYSQGLEYAVHEAWITDEQETAGWILGLLRHPLSRLEIPVFARLYRAWQVDSPADIVRWNDWLYASREAAELQREDQHLGRALARLLTDLGLPAAAPWRTADRVCFATLFSLAAVRWGIPLNDAALGLLWAWTENQVAAAAKLGLLGQTASQRLLSRAMPEIAAAVAQGLALDDDGIGCAAPGLGLASAGHETQYSRLFRS